MFEAKQATLPTKRGVYARFIPEEKVEVGKRAALAAEHSVVETVLRVLPKSGLGTSGLGNTSVYERAWLIGSFRENCFHQMLVEGQSTKYLRFENIVLCATLFTRRIITS